MGVEQFDKVKAEMKEVVVPKVSGAVGKRIVELNIPYTVHIMAIKRGDHYIQPIGSTKIVENDRLFLLARRRKVNGNNGAVVEWVTKLSAFNT